MNAAAHALSTLIDAMLALRGGHPFTQPFDPDWRSPAEQAVDGDRTLWRPVPQTPPVDWRGLENALELTLHDDIKAWYGSWWSGTLTAQAEEGPVELMQLWNPEDFERLVANLIGHALNKRKRREPFSVFFATTDPDTEYFLAIHHATGVVQLETPDQGVMRVVEPDLATFLRRLTPVDAEPQIY